MNGVLTAVRNTSILQVAVALATLAMVFSVSCTMQGQVLRKLPSPGLDVSSSNNREASDLVGLQRHRRITPSISKRSFKPQTYDNGYPASWHVTSTERKWDSLVIHHSACERGSAALFDKAHRARGWDELGYHFVIGNGSLTPDGYVEVGSRWPKQKHGAHAKTPSNHYNELGIGICLIGNFEQKYPSGSQLQALEKLSEFLTGRYAIPAGRILGHREIRGTRTLCPGKNFPMRQLRASVADGQHIWAGSGY